MMMRAGVEDRRRLNWLDKLHRRSDEEHGALPLAYETVKKLHDDVLALEDNMAKGGILLLRPLAALPSLPHRVGFVWSGPACDTAPLFSVSVSHLV